MVDILGYTIGISLALLASQAVSALLAFIAVVISDNYIGHNIELRRALVLSVISFFIVPLIIPYLGLNYPYLNLYFPLISWIILGEIILNNDFGTKLKILGVAFFVYYVLNIIIQPFIMGYLRFLN
ncbi:MAG: hypothetical protein J4431_04330 [Candidatus Aenigmarchaeota archaeon]|nr:hypothetical protein [Candidatus Aenigmarchaeota archaeon]